MLLNKNIKMGASVTIRMGREILPMQSLTGSPFLLKPFAILRR
jgi:hypothetical protein